jgi:two-component system, NtrC family, sensor kinase
VGGGETSIHVLGRSAQVCGLACCTIGAGAIVGSATRQPFLMGVRESYIPMAPNTAIGFLVLGAGLFAVAADQIRLIEITRNHQGPRSGHVDGSDRRRWVRELAGVGAVVVALVCVLRLVEFWAGTNFAVDSWFLRGPAGKLGSVPLGKMAFFTAIAFLGASLGLALLAWSRLTSSQEAWSLAGAGATVTGAVGLVFALGYLFSPEAPLLYGSESIPMALNTAVGFVLLGTGLAAAVGPSSFPLYRVCGTSISARLLRVFLPLVVGTVVMVAWLTHVVSTTVGSSSTAISSAALATAAIFVFGFSLERIAGRVGQRIEQAEAALQQAHDQLELKVQERTRALYQANEKLAGMLRDLNVAHSALQKSHEELKQTQGRMLQQAKLASLGQTAAGVAHEINNPLAFVTNDITVLKREVTDLHDILRLYQQAETTLAAYQHDLLKRIRELSDEVDLPFVQANLDGLLDRSREGLKRIQKIVENLRDFAHLEEAESQEADLSAGVSATVGILHELAARKHVTLETELEHVQKVNCYPAKINMVVQNLVLNAIDACAAGGKVVVRTRTREEAVEIEVADDGCGIDPAIQGKVFDPFFTTKPVGQGTGLGLSMSYGIIKDHGGSIDFESEPGRGTRFTLLVPFSPIRRFASPADSQAPDTRPAPAQA